MRRGILFGLMALMVMAPAAISWADEHEDDDADIGGNIRLRTEYKRPFNYFDADGGDPTGDDGTFMRTQLHFGWELANNVGVMVQVQDSRVWGTEDITAGSSTADIDLKQAYVSIGNLQEMGSLGFLGDNDFDMKIGRLNVPTFDDGYILASNDWSNTGPLSYDGLWIDGGFGGVDLDFLWADLVNTDPYAGGAIGPAEGATSWYLRAAFDDLDFADVAVYYSNFSGDFAGFTGLDQTTFGFRLDSKLGDVVDRLNVVFEWAQQGGDSDQGDFGGDLMVIRAEYELEVEGLDPVIGVGLSSASGDSTAGDGDIDTWLNPLDWTHGHLGHYDLFDNSNIDDFFITASATLMDDIRVNLDYHILTLNDEADGWYSPTAGVNGGATDDDLGTEIDLYATWDCGESLSFQAGASLFQTGDAVDQIAGFDDDGTFFYVQMMVPFGS